MTGCLGSPHPVRTQLESHPARCRRRDSAKSLAGLQRSTGCPKQPARGTGTGQHAGTAWPNGRPCPTCSPHVSHAPRSSVSAPPALTPTGVPPGEAQQDTPGRVEGLLSKHQPGTITPSGAAGFYQGCQPQARLEAPVPTTVLGRTSPAVQAQAKQTNTSPTLPGSPWGR